MGESRGPRRARCRVAVAALALLACALSPARAVAGEGLLVGASDDLFKHDPALAGRTAADLGLRAARVSLRWDPGQTQLSAADEQLLVQAVSTGVRVVVWVAGPNSSPPLDYASRSAYCAYVRDAVARVPQINDVVVWNEPNLSLFWRPQFDPNGQSVSPAAYQALLAHCWDVLHAFRPTINVLAPATSPVGFDGPYGPTISHAPSTFIKKMGAAYRESGRDRPLFDTVAHHVYGSSAGERPWRWHTTHLRISQGDLNRLITTLDEAFAGTAQPVPGRPVAGKAVSIWFTEAGFETIPDPEKRHLYVGEEAVNPIPDWVGAPPWTTLPDAESPAPDQATQLRDALRLAYCQPYVTGFFNFLIRDEPNLWVYQSGLLWLDDTPKDSYAPFRDAVAEVARGDVDCPAFGYPARPKAPLPPAAPASGAAGGAEAGEPIRSGLARAASVVPGESASPARGEQVTKRPTLTILRLVWPRGDLFTGQTRGWRVGVRVSVTARYSVSIGGGMRAGGTRSPVARGFVEPGALRWIRLPRRPLSPGAYRVKLVLSAPGLPPVVRQSPSFRVRRGAR